MAAKVEIFPKNMEINDKTRDTILRKVNRLDRYIPDVNETRIDLDYQKSMRNPSDRQVAQITMRGRGYILRSEERAEDILSAIDLAVDKLQRKIERFKGKRDRGRGDGTPTGVGAPDPEAVPEAPLQERIVRRKTFELTPMDEEEALEQMAAVGHENFFIFYNTSTNSINVLYARRDGKYGLIEPTLR